MSNTTSNTFPTSLNEVSVRASQIMKSENLIIEKANLLSGKTLEEQATILSGIDELSIPMLNNINVWDHSSKIASHMQYAYNVLMFMDYKDPDSEDNSPYTFGECRVMVILICQVLEDITYKHSLINPDNKLDTLLDYGVLDLIK